MRWVQHSSFNYYKNVFPNYKQSYLRLFTSANQSAKALMMLSEDMQIFLCIDSGCTRHSCNNDTKYVNLSDIEIKTVGLKNNGTA